MFDRVRRQLLRLLRVPHMPVPPLGAPGSVRVFRAGDNYCTLLFVRWGFAQVGALIGLLVGLYFGAMLYDHIGDLRRAPPPAPAPAGPPAKSSTVTGDTPRAAPADPAAKRAPRDPRALRQHRPEFLRTAAKGTLAWVQGLIIVAEGVGILIFIGQFFATLVAVRLEFEQHWYIVTDRSLRIRTGLVTVREATMSFANLQQVVVSQGPLQRLLGLADVCVQSAGGGGDDERKPGADAALHTGVFHSVPNAPEIRDLILDRLRQFRATGLGDPDDARPVPAASVPAADTLAAARELLQEAAALRRATTGRA